MLTCVGVGVRIKKIGFVSIKVRGALGAGAAAGRVVARASLRKHALRRCCHSVTSCTLSPARPSARMLTCTIPLAS